MVKNLYSIRQYIMCCYINFKNIYFIFKMQYLSKLISKCRMEFLPLRCLANVFVWSDTYFHPIYFHACPTWAVQQVQPFAQRAAAGLTWDQRPGATRYRFTSFISALDFFLCLGCFWCLQLCENQEVLNDSKAIIAMISAYFQKTEIIKMHYLFLLFIE